MQWRHSIGYAVCKKARSGIKGNMELLKKLLTGEGAGEDSCKTEEEKELQHVTFITSSLKL